MSPPSVSHWTCAVPKAGGGEADYEDAAAVADERWPVCAAVADGATESVFAGDWANRLAHGLGEQGAMTAEAFRAGLPTWQAEWETAVHERVQRRPWYVTAKAAEGAFATVLGLSLHADGQWRALSIGDCCLFHVRNEALVQSWPFESPDAFTNRPALVPSRSDREGPPPETTTGIWQTGDRFLLATDAVAAWLLTDELEHLPAFREDTVHERVHAARTEGRLRNDDTTLLVLEMSASPRASGERSKDP